MVLAAVVLQIRLSCVAVLCDGELGTAHRQPCCLVEKCDLLPGSGYFCTLQRELSDFSESFLPFQQCTEHLNPANSAFCLYSQPSAHCSVHTTDTQKLLLHVLALPWCNHQEVFTVVKVMLSKWFAVCSTVTHFRARTQRYQDCTTHIWVSRWPLDDCWLYSEDRRTPVTA